MIQALSFCCLCFILANVTIKVLRHLQEIYMPEQTKNFYDFDFTMLDGSKPEQLKNKVILVVNTASKCGFTPQYKELEKLYQTYKDQGFVILAIPSASFGGQEFAESCDIQRFINDKFTVSFPVTEKYSVRGNKAHPFYIWAATNSSLFAKPKWNFHKYLIAKNGDLVNWFAPTTSPTSSKVMLEVEKYLAT